MEAIKQEIRLDENYTELFRELIHRQLGIYISPDKNYLLENKISRLVNRGGYQSVQELYKMLKDNKKGTMEDLVRYITTTHTFFFRENKHLAILRKDIMIRNIAHPLIWVAASSTGEEVYSIIIELLEHGISDFFIVATDINTEVLRHCKRGVYSRDRMKELSEDILRKYFDRVDEGRPGEYFRVKEYLRKYFIVKKINLIDNLRFEAKFHYIFCRNVLIYFNLETQRRVLDVLTANLRDLGYLFVGHSESLIHITDKLESVFSSVYNKKL
ncbi:MAG: protein-glutamate O-methyltransferase CheR [Spirochaetales bacterium]|nr:protein-glutamate O-methyltransferase CheR [Spirochaetales bacterium]